MYLWSGKRYKTSGNAHKPCGIYEKCVKRALDCFLSGIGLIVLSPVIGVTALLVRLNLGSPVLFQQERPGLNEKIFRLKKFRSMLPPQTRDGKVITDEERTRLIEQGVDVLSDEERLTKFGRILRATSLDELPELWNIFVGDMSIVGPRPLLARYLPRYNAHQARRHEVRPGLTGLAQVHGRNAINWEEKFDWDIKYVDNITFRGDCKIIFDTVKTVIKREGISSDTSATMDEFMGNEEKV